MFISDHREKEARWLFTVFVTKGQMSLQSVLEFPDGTAGWRSGVATAEALVIAVVWVQSLVWELLPQMWPKIKNKKKPQSVLTNSLKIFHMNTVKEKWAKHLNFYYEKKNAKECDESPGDCHPASEIINLLPTLLFVIICFFVNTSPSHPFLTGQFWNKFSHIILSMHMSLWTSERIEKKEAKKKKKQIPVI